MSLAEIKNEVAQLSIVEIAELTAYLAEINLELWDRQLELDAAAGKLDFLIEEAENARNPSSLGEWPGV